MFLRATITAAALAAASAHAAAATTHVRTRTYGSLRMSYDDLATIVRDIRVQASAANQLAPADSLESLQLKQGNAAVKFASDFALDAMSKPMEEANFIHYLFMARGAPISEVSVWLDDTYR